MAVPDETEVNDVRVILVVIFVRDWTESSSIFVSKELKKDSAFQLILLLCLAERLLSILI